MTANSITYTSNNMVNVGENETDIWVPPFMKTASLPDSGDDFLSFVQDLAEYGCAGGTYMPAVTYFDAQQTMAEHGDEVTEYIWERLGEVPEVPKDERESWKRTCVWYLSLAVELWAHEAHDMDVDWAGDEDE
tara:strand:- start:198 stop:596 length:399 start_codon:yes stop_codon:yes gene_type:complete